MSKEKITCRTHCIYWNSIDKDCEIYGEQHIPPRKCAIYKNGLIIEKEDSAKNAHTEKEQINE